jgi:hypothetical protein
MTPRNKGKIHLARKVVTLCVALALRTQSTYDSEGT